MSTSYSITRDTVTIQIDGGQSRVISLATPQGRAVARAIKRRDLDQAKLFATDRLAAAREHVKDVGLDLDALPEAIKNRALQMADKDEDPTGLAKFWERLQQNPSKRAVDGLYTFLDHQGIPILKDGTFLAYKGVSDDLYDCHSHTNHNTPGSVFQMPRNKISDDPRTPCHEGLHVGAHGYARSFGPREIVCQVAPENVVCIPYDESAQKMRVCEYRVVGHFGGKLLTEDEDLADYEDYSDAFAEEPADTGDARAELLAEEINPRHVAPEKVRHFGRLTSRQLMDKSLDELRAYGKKLKIVGASKITGGKSALVRAITKARRGSKG